MNTLKTLSTLLIVTVSLNAFAETKSNHKTKDFEKNSSVFIKNPAMEWGNPDDANSESVKNLLTSPYLLFNAPEMIWGNPDQADTKYFENLNNSPIIEAPEMIWGNPSEVMDVILR